MKAESRRQVTAVLCAIAGVMHILGGRFLVLLLGLGYLGAAAGLLGGWKHARTLAGGVAGTRFAGTCLLLLFKVPGLLAGTSGSEDTVMFARDGFWLVMNGAILMLVLSLGLTPPSNHGVVGGA